MSLNARAGGAAGRASLVGSPNNPPASQAGSPGGKRLGAAGPRVGGRWGPRCRPCGGRGGGLTARTGPAVKGAAAGDCRREPEGDRKRRAIIRPGELF